MTQETSTSISELENGVFTLVITLVQTLVGQGLTRPAACAQVVGYLTSITNALRKEFEQPNQGAVSGD